MSALLDFLLWVSGWGFAAVAVVGWAIERLEVVRARRRITQFEDMLGTGDERVRREAAAKLRERVRQNAGDAYWGADRCRQELEAADELERGGRAS